VADDQALNAHAGGPRIHLEGADDDVLACGLLDAQLDEVGQPA